MMTRLSPTDELVEVARAAVAALEAAIAENAEASRHHQSEAVKLADTATDLLHPPEPQP